ncbi:MAG: Phosphate-specific transport system accessory protein PhoU [Fimbriimonadaceae bacterium]|nr:Phosphate-specific transport system accessory protein PhoU [Fimbriimonadaceae bacterium]
MTIRHHFDEKLHEIEQSIVQMGNGVSDMLTAAIKATATHDRGLARQVIGSDNEIDQLEEDILRDTCFLVMQEAPVAADLKRLTATLGIVGEIEKYGDDAVKLARRSIKVGQQFRAELINDLVQLGVQTNFVLGSAIRLYTGFDPEVVNEVRAYEARVDQEVKAVRNRIFKMIEESPGEAEALIRTLSIFQACEHAADHAIAMVDRLQIHYSSSSASSASS